MFYNVIKKSLQLFVCVFIFIQFSSCKTDRTPIPNSLNTFGADGGRTYILHVPPGYSKDSPVPLVVALHGYTSTAKNFEEWTHISEKADEEDFIVIYPNGIAYPWNDANPQAWNVGGPWEEWTRDTDDVGFIKGLIEMIGTYYSIDKNRIYITGHSNGARMTYRLAWELSDIIAAVAPVAGILVYDKGPGPTSPVSILHIHSKNDDTVPYDGQTLEGIRYPGAEAMLAYWAELYGCSEEPAISNINDTCELRVWDCTDKGFELQLFSPDDGRHMWHTVENSGIDATSLIWDFFEKHPKGK